MNIIITSEHRVGSRWLHYLLADLFSMDVSPELDAKKLRYKSTQTDIQKRFKENKIVKFHHALPDEILKYVTPHDYIILGVVRNPRDRAVSFAFHNRYHKSDYPFKQKEFATDFDAVKYTVFSDDAFRENSDRQFKLMIPGYSTKNKVLFDMPYMWTSYEWMKENTFNEITKLANFRGSALTDVLIKNAIRRNSFKNKSGRNPGQELRSSLWRRKGITGDFLNWFDEPMIESTEEEYAKYFEILNKELS